MPVHVIGINYFYVKSNSSLPIFCRNFIIEHDLIHRMITPVNQIRNIIFFLILCMEVPWYESWLVWPYMVTGILVTVSSRKLQNCVDYLYFWYIPVSPCFNNVSQVEEMWKPASNVIVFFSRHYMELVNYCN